VVDNLELATLDAHRTISGGSRVELNQEGAPCPGLDRGGKRRLGRWAIYQSGKKWNWKQRFSEGQHSNPLSVTQPASGRIIMDYVMISSPIC
jgi:hypothetical protein